MGLLFEWLFCIYLLQKLKTNSMIIDKQESVTIITKQNETFNEFFKNVEDAYDTFKNDHIIVNIFDIHKLIAHDINIFLPLSQKHKASKHSFVIVNDKIAIEEINEHISLVPTLEEAQDIIEMENIERDLELDL